jgi:disease resistance protein RPS2
MAVSPWTVLSAITSVISFIVVFTTKWFDPHFESFGYPFDTNRRIKDMMTLVENLKEIKDDLCRLNPQPSWEQEKGWFRSVHKALKKVHDIKELHDRNQSSMFRKFSVGRKSDAEAKRLKDLITEGRALLASARANPLPIHQIVPQLPQHILIGRDSVIKRVFDFLGESDASANGILCLRGACGTGKSVLLQMVRDSCSQMSSFDFVIFVVATSDCTVQKLQRAILASIGLGITVANEESIAAVIFNVLKDKSFLLLLDDLWGRVDLERVGVPMPLLSTHQFRRKLIFTTRSLSVCADMESAHNYISLEYLDAGHAWKLFEEKAGRASIHCHPHVPYLAAEVIYFIILDLEIVY